jgi:hypothetical protein
MHRVELDNVLRCEDLITPVESLFQATCAARGRTVADIASTLVVDTDLFESARRRFGDSGSYGSGGGGQRQERMVKELDTSSVTALIHSVLKLHGQVAEERRTAPWAWIEQDRVTSDLELDGPKPELLVPGVAWRNDYYLRPLRLITTQLRAPVEH